MILRAERFMPPRPRAADLIEGWPENYSEDYKHPTRQAQIEAGQREPFRRLDLWALGKSPELPGFLIYGAPGFGKTGLALACLYRLALKSYLCRFATAEHFAIKRESTTYSPKDGQTADSLLKELLAPEILVLDDIGTREYSGQVRAILFDAIRERHSGGGLTILTTNIPLDAKEGRERFSQSFDARVLSTYTGQGFNSAEWKAGDQPARSLRAIER